MKNKKTKVAILGSGNIGTDLLFKIMRSKYLECSAFIGRRSSSEGIAIAKRNGVQVSIDGIEYIRNNPNCCEIVFDATSALDHKMHWSILKDLKKFVIDMTPSKIGSMVVPAVDSLNIKIFDNVNMISCGGQVSIPLAYIIGKCHDYIDYIEVVSSIASLSAGPATRINIDEYVETTETAIQKYSGCKQAKVILILNPADPPINMQTTISAKVKEPNLNKLNELLDDMVMKIQHYVPGYEVVVPPIWETNRIVISVRVKGAGDYLPSYSGNLDIINAAGIAVAEEYHKKKNCVTKTKGDLNGKRDFNL